MEKSKLLVKLSVRQRSSLIYMCERASKGCFGIPTPCLAKTCVIEQCICLRYSQEET